MMARKLWALLQNPKNDHHASCQKTNIKENIFLQISLKNVLEKQIMFGLFFIFCQIFAIVDDVSKWSTLMALLWNFSTDTNIVYKWNLRIIFFKLMTDNKKKRTLLG